MRRRHSKYKLEFKQECVQYIIDNPDMTFVQIAEALSVPASTLQKWYKTQTFEITDSDEQEGVKSSDRAEIKRLKAEVRRLKMEAEILKKAAAFFAKDPD